MSSLNRLMSDVDLNVDDFNHLAFDVANNSKSVQNNDNNILYVDCEVDDIHFLLDEKHNKNDNKEMAAECAHNDSKRNHYNITSSVEPAV